MNNEIKEILELIGNNYYYGNISEIQKNKYCDYITNLQEENTKKDNVMNGIEEFIEYLDRETNVYLVNTAYTVILGKLKKLKIDNGLLQGDDKSE